MQHFGEQTLDVLAQEPERLTELSGIGPKRAAMIAESYREQVQQRDAMMFLQRYGVGPSLAVKIFKTYGERAQELIRQNPYRLIQDVTGVGFKTADRIAASLGIEKSSEYRLSAGVLYALEEAGASSGHTYLPRPTLLERAARLLDVAPEQLEGDDRRADPQPQPRRPRAGHGRGHRRRRLPACVLQRGERGCPPPAGAHV